MNKRTLPYRSGTRRSQPPSRLGPRAGATAAAALALGAMAWLLPSVGRPAAAAPSGPAQAQSVMVFPNLQTAGNWDDWASDAPTGMDGMGESVIEVMNMAPRSASMTFDFHSNVVSRVLTSAVLPPLMSGRFALDAVKATEFSNYSGRVTSDAPVGGVVRTTWYGGASVVHEALSPARDLVLPLIMREVYSNSSIIYLKNLNPPGEDNNLTFHLFEEHGSIRMEWVVRLVGDEALPDDLYSARVFYQDLPVNAAGGFIGTFHVSAEDPVAVAIYGDEPYGVGSYALTGRPASAAADRQYLPLVRANYMGDTLIGLTNMENKAVDVTITYQGHPASPSGASQTIRQTLRIPAHFYASVDLSDLGRGTPGLAPPNVPRGDGFNTGFLGSASIRASGKIIAAAWEEYRENNYVLGSGAYNAFSPADLGNSFAVPRAFMTADGMPSFLIAMNPGSDPAEVTATLYNDDGSIYGDLYPVTVEPGQMQFLAVATPDYDNVRVIARSTQPIALLVLDARPTRDRTVYSAVRMPADTVFPTPTPTVRATVGPSPTASATGQARTATPTVHPVWDYWAYLPAAFRKH